LRKELEEKKRIEIELVRKTEKEEYERRFQKLLQSSFKLAFVVQGNFAQAMEKGHFASGSFNTYSSEAGIYHPYSLTIRIEEGNNSG